MVQPSVIVPIVGAAGTFAVVPVPVLSALTPTGFLALTKTETDVLFPYPLTVKGFDGAVVQLDPPLVEYS